MRLKINFSDGSREYKGSFGEIQPTIQPDWSQNNPKDPRYIQNRTHYDSRVFHPGTITFEKTYDTPLEKPGAEKIADAPIDIGTLKAIDVATTYHAGNGDGNHEFHGTIYEIYEFSSEVGLPPESAYEITFSDENHVNFYLQYCATDEAAAALGIEPGLYVEIEPGATSCSITLHTETVTGELKTIDHKYIDDMYYKTSEYVTAEGTMTDLIYGGDLENGTTAGAIFSNAGITATNAKVYFIINGKRFSQSEARYMTASEAGETGYQFKYVIGDYEVRVISYNAGTYNIIPEGTDFHVFAEGTATVYHKVPDEYLPEYCNSTWEALDSVSFASANAVTLNFSPYYEKYRKLYGVIPNLRPDTGATTEYTRICYTNEGITTWDLVTYQLFRVHFEAERIGKENKWIVKAWRLNPESSLSITTYMRSAIVSAYNVNNIRFSISYTPRKWMAGTINLWGDEVMKITEWDNINGLTEREETEEEKAEREASEGKTIDPTTEERISALEAAMLEMIMGGNT